jgi:GT2 family glycosyltransferase
LSTNQQIRHTVTAIIVSHDGARLLPGLVQALRAQTYQVEQTVAVDTGSRDRSGAVLAELIGQDAVFGMDRSTGYGEAVTVALRHATRRRSGLTDPNLARVEWLWLLHDDCEPAPDALDQLLRAASKDRTVVVLGPKVLDGQDRRTLREAGVSIDRAGRRVTGIDPGEIDQGQHDHKRAVLAVGSAGMLVRRDVWERLGGFDPRLRFFRDDVDFCWRVQAAGARVQVVTDAVLYHHELAGRRRRPIDGGNARRLDRQSALYVLAANLPLLAMLRVVGGCVLGSLVRAAYFLLTKQLDQAAAYAFSVLWLFGHPVRLFRARRRRARVMAEGYTAVRLFIQPARTLSQLAEKIAGLMSHGPPQASGGRHQATAEESEEDEQFTDTQSLMRRFIGHPGVQLFTALLIISLISERRLLGSSPLGGGALVPAWDGASALWREYLAGFHAVGVGSTASAPPYLAVVAGLATVLGGQAWLAVDVLLLGCVPLAGLTAYLASRWLVTATPARVLLAASYALLPVATGAVAAGRLGTSAAFALLPLIGLSAGRMLTAAPRQARRAAWATGLLIALASAFAPFTWVLGAVFAIGALAARRWLVAVDPRCAAIVIVTPFFVLFPWSLHLLTGPAAFLSEAGLAPRGLTTTGLKPAALLALSPGGPGVPPLWVTLGLGLALVATVLHGRRTGLVIAGWIVAGTGLLAATLVSRVSVTPLGGGQASDGWPGVALALAALGLLIASAPAAQRLAAIVTNSDEIASGAGQPAPAPHRSAGHGRPVRLAACAALAAAATAPLLVAAYWVKDGVHGPVGSVSAPVLPAFVTAASAAGQHYRTLILRPDQGGLASGGLDYMVVRQGDPTIGDPELGIDSAAGAALSRQIAALGALDGADAGDPGLVLGEFGIRWVLLPGPVSPVLAQRLDAALGLVALSKAPTYDLWQVTGPVARVRAIAADGTAIALSSGALNEGAITVPATSGTLLLAEPYGGWTANLNGGALKPLTSPVDGWAQGFVLPPGGGRLSISHDDLARELSLFLELIAVLVVCLLALPGKRADPVEEAEALAALREARNGRRAAASAGRGSRPAVLRGAGHRAAGLAARSGAARSGAARFGVDRSGADRSGADRSGAGRPGLARRRRPGQLPVTGADQGVREPEGTEEKTTAGVVNAPPGALVNVPDLPDGAPHDAPWDMAGDWGSGSRAGAANAWATSSLDDAWGTSSPEEARGRGARARLTGHQPPVRETPVRETPVRETPGPETPGPETPGPETPGRETPVPGAEPPATRTPWETGPQRAPWDSGPQPPVPPAGTRPPGTRSTGSRSTGTQSRYAWETGPQSTVSSSETRATGAQVRYPWETGPQRRATPTEGQPTAATGAQHVARTGGQPAARPGAQHVTLAGGQSAAPGGSEPGPLPPWESGEWPVAGGSPAAPGGPGAPGARPEPGTGSGPWPVASASSRPERHSHRAAKHGRPSRWRGTGKRSGGDGES